MATELVTFKLDSGFLKEIDAISKDSGFSSRTDFIRNALREKLYEIKLNESMIRLGKFRGISKRHTTDEEIHRVGEKVFRELARERGIKLD